MNEAEQKADASKKRAAKKSVLTKEINTIMKLVRSGIKDEVEERRGRLKQKYTAMEEAHDAYHDLLTEEAEISESDSWFDKAEDSYITVLSTMKDLFDNSAKSTEVSSIEDKVPKMEISVANELASFMNLPKLEIEKYNGDPLKYRIFCDEAVDKKTMDASVKLTRLLQSTIDKAHYAISHCVLIGGDAGYQQAREILNLRCH